MYEEHASEAMCVVRCKKLDHISVAEVCMYPAVYTCMCSYLNNIASYIHNKIGIGLVHML